MRRVINTVLLLSLSLSLFPLFQNCGRTVTFLASEDTPLKLGQAVLVDKVIDPKNWENRPEIHVTAVVDNSNSMSPIQQAMAEALGRSLDPLNEFSGEIQLFTTTQNLQKDKPSVELVYENAMGEIQLNEPTERPFKKIFRLPASFIENNSDSGLRFSPENFSAAKQSFLNGISNLGTSGDAKEETICSLMRAVDAKKSDNSAFQALLVVTNEDDHSEILNCPKEIEYVTAEVQAEEVKDCETYADVLDENNPNCKFETIVRKTQTLRNASFELKLQSPVENFMLKTGESNITRASLGYRQFLAYYNIKRISKKQTVQYQMKYEYKDDGIVDESLTQYRDFGNTAMIPKEIGKCSSLSPEDLMCDASTISQIMAQNHKLNGSSGQIVPNSCQISCVDEVGPTEQVDHITGQFRRIYHYGNIDKLDRSFDRCESLDNLAECNLVTSQTSRKYVTVYSYGMNAQTCDSKANSVSNTLSSEWLSTDDNSAYGKLSIASHYYNSSSDTLRKIINAHNNGGAEVSEGDVIETVSARCDRRNKYTQIHKKADGSFYRSNINNWTTWPSRVKAFRSDYTGSYTSACSAEDISSINGASNSSSLRYGENIVDCRKGPDTVSSVNQLVASGTTIDRLMESGSNLLESENICNTNNVISTFNVSIPQGSVATSCQVKTSGSTIVKTCNLSEHAPKENLCGDASKLANLIDTNCSGNFDGFDTSEDISSSNSCEIVGKYTKQNNIDEDRSISKAIIPNDFSSENIANHLKAKFGNNYYLASFTTPDTNVEGVNIDECVGDNPQAFEFGSSFVDIESIINRDNSVPLAKNFSVCENDYSPAMELVVNKILSEVQFSYKLNFEFNERIYKVFLINSNGEEILADTSDYEYANGILKFVNKTLIDDDTYRIRVVLWRDLLALQ
ncbi:MAG: hypothetical protein AB8E15_04330 [Bdellovibrionales bacterium]